MSLGEGVAKNSERKSYTYELVPFWALPIIEVSFFS